MALAVRPPPPTFSLPLLNRMLRVERKVKNLMVRDKYREIICQLLLQAKQTQCGGNYVYCEVRMICTMRNKYKLNRHLHPSIFFSPVRLNLTPLPRPLPPLPYEAQGMGNEGCAKTIIALLCSSFPSLFPCLCVGASTGCWETPHSPWSLHGLQGDLCSSTWDISSSSFFSHLSVPKVISSFFFPFLLSIIG